VRNSKCNLFRNYSLLLSTEAMKIARLRFALPEADAVFDSTDEAATTSSRVLRETAHKRLCGFGATPTAIFLWIFRVYRSRLAWLAGRAHLGVYRGRVPHRSFHDEHRKSDRRSPASPLRSRGRLQPYRSYLLRGRTT
jgi:hypothetical protein